MPWRGDVRQCACSRAASLLLCILRVFKIGPGEPLMFLLKKRDSSPAEVVRAGATRRGAEHLRNPPFLPLALQVPSPQRKEPINAQGPTGPVDLLLPRSA